MDLSLEFPDRYQFTSLNARIAQDICHVTGQYKGQHYLKSQGGMGLLHYVM